MAEAGRMSGPGDVPVPRGRGGVAGPAATPRRAATPAPARGRGPAPAGGTPRCAAQPLADLLDRLVDRGVVVSGDVVIALAGVDLIRLDLRLLLVGVQTAVEGAREVGG